MYGSLSSGLCNRAIGISSCYTAAGVGIAVSDLWGSGLGLAATMVAGHRGASGHEISETAMYIIRYHHLLFF